MSPSTYELAPEPKSPVAPEVITRAPPLTVSKAAAVKTPCAIEAKIHATENLKDINQRVGVTFFHVL